jgi:hypothetical protein
VRWIGSGLRPLTWPDAAAVLSFTTFQQHRGHIAMVLMLSRGRQQPPAGSQLMGVPGVNSA